MDLNMEKLEKMFLAVENNPGEKYLEIHISGVYKDRLLTENITHACMLKFDFYKENYTFDLRHKDIEGVRIVDAKVLKYPFDSNKCFVCEKRLEQGIPVNAERVGDFFRYKHMECAS